MPHLATCTRAPALTAQPSVLPPPTPPSCLSACCKAPRLTAQKRARRAAAQMAGCSHTLGGAAAPDGGRRLSAPAARLCPPPPAPSRAHRPKKMAHMHSVTWGTRIPIPKAAPIGKATAWFCNPPPHLVARGAVGGHAGLQRDGLPEQKVLARRDAWRQTKKQGKQNACEERGFDTSQGAYRRRAARWPTRPRPKRPAHLVLQWAAQTPRPGRTSPPPPRPRARAGRLWRRRARARLRGAKRRRGQKGAVRHASAAPSARHATSPLGENPLVHEALACLQSFTCILRSMHVLHFALRSSPSHASLRISSESLTMCSASSQPTCIHADRVGNVCVPPKRARTRHTCTDANSKTRRVGTTHR